jgi:hypothetical protein
MPRRPGALAPRECGSDVRPHEMPREPSVRPRRAVVMRGAPGLGRTGDFRPDRTVRGAPPTRASTKERDGELHDHRHFARHPVSWSRTSAAASGRSAGSRGSCLTPAAAARGPARLRGGGARQRRRDEAGAVARVSRRARPDPQPARCLNRAASWRRSPRPRRTLPSRLGERLQARSDQGFGDYQTTLWPQSSGPSGLHPLAAHIDRWGRPSVRWS